MRIYRWICFALTAAMLFSFSACRSPEYETVSNLPGQTGTPQGFQAKTDGFYLQTEKGEQKVYLCGVNMGLTEATTSLDNPNVSYDTYREWFAWIAEMNANTVKVFTVMPPQFYNAFYDFNTENPDTPLYLLQGIWFNEDYMYSIGDAYADDTIDTAFRRAAKETVDIVHGNSDYTTYGEIENAVYNSDVSGYLAGFILGLEWDSQFVIQTNTHTDKSDYTGEYLTTDESAAPFEAFLCGVGDYLIAYQTETYDFQTPVAFLNWATTDTITHTNEPFPEEDAVGVNTENILATDAFNVGLFAAVDAYPYYPEFMNHQPEYVDFVDPDTGEKNPYRGYLDDLLGEYTVPVIIAEVGLPTSRGSAHTSVTGYNQGGITETQQGEYLAQMLRSIYAEGYAGSMLFSWQDEWFKQTWNTVKYTPDDPSRRTPNRQSAEQSYGILAMEPGESAACYTDGDFSEWTADDKVCETDGYTLYSKYDEGYLYFYVQPANNYDFANDTLLLPVSTVGLGSTKSNDYNVSFDTNADFLIVINGQDNTRVLTDAYYDAFHYQYAVCNGVYPVNESYRVQNAGVYNTIRQFLSNEIVLPQTGEVIDPVSYESGLLRFGNNDPASEDYDSLADFNGSNAGVELRIPWYLLNVMNAADGVAIADFYTQEPGTDMTFTNFDSIKAGLAPAGGTQTIRLSDTGYNGIETVQFHTRLKSSYSILQKAIGELMGK